MPTLREIQVLFHRLATAPEDVPRTLATLGESAAVVERVIAGDARLSAVDRLDIYAQMYFARILEVLGEFYPTVLRAVGEGAFHDLVTDYLVACPPSHFSLGRAGDRLPSFLETHRLAADRPWLPAVAAVEAAQIDVFDAADAAPLDLAQLQALGAERFFDLPLVLVPASAVVTSRWAIDTLFEPDRAEESPAPRETAVLVWREGFDVRRRVLTEDERIAHASATQGATFGALCDAFLAVHDEETAASAALAVLLRWVDGGILVDPQAERSSRAEPAFVGPGS